MLSGYFYRWHLSTFFSTFIYSRALRMGQVELGVLFLDVTWRGLTCFWRIKRLLEGANKRFWNPCSIGCTSHEFILHSDFAVKISGAALWQCKWYRWNQRLCPNTKLLLDFSYREHSVFYRALVKQTNNLHTKPTVFFYSMSLQCTGKHDACLIRFSAIQTAVDSRK